MFMIAIGDIITERIQKCSTQAEQDGGQQCTPDCQGWQATADQDFLHLSLPPAPRVVRGNRPH